MNQFILSCCSTVDVPYAHLQERQVPVLFYSYTVNGQLYEDDMCRHAETLPRFYQQLQAGAQVSTSQINVATYEDFFEQELQKGDLLHLAFGSGMTGSVYNAQAAAEHLKEKYPQRKIAVVDTLCSSSGYGMLVDSVADLRDQGKSFEEALEWVMEARHRVHHQFFVTDLTQFRRSGRLPAVVAAMSTALNICPLLRLDAGGHIVPCGKVRGRRRAIDATVGWMQEHAIGGAAYADKCWICHSQCPELAEQLAEQVKSSFPKLPEEIRICSIGATIGCHCGPGTAAVFFYGDHRAE